jgi:predicted MFS family arabinose efflux permease
MTYVPMGILVDRLFEERSKGLAYALITNGTAIGFIVLSPLWVFLAPQVAWQTLFLIVGLVFLLPISLALFFASKTTLPLPAAEKSLPASWGAVLRDPHFYVLALGFASCGATMAFIDVHLVPFWEDARVSRSVMGMSLSLLGALALASGVVAGWRRGRAKDSCSAGITCCVRWRSRCCWCRTSLSTRRCLPPCSASAIQERSC